VGGEQKETFTKFVTNKIIKMRSAIFAQKKPTHINDMNVRHERMKYIKDENKTKNKSKRVFLNELLS